MSNHASPGTTHTLSTGTKVLVAVTVLLLAGVATLGVRTLVMGVPLFDSWACAKGSAPVVMVEDEGTYCAVPDAKLDEGEVWHPLGNHPLECYDRWGWTPVVMSDPATDDEQSGCLAQDEEMPSGWSAEE